MKYLGSERSNPPIGKAATFHALEDGGRAVGIGRVLGRIEDRTRLSSDECAGPTSDDRCRQRRA